MLHPRFFFFITLISSFLTVFLYFNLYYLNDHAIYQRIRLLITRSREPQKCKVKYMLHLNKHCFFFWFLSLFAQIPLLLSSRGSGLDNLPVIWSRLVPDFTGTAPQRSIQHAKLRTINDVELIPKTYMLEEHCGRYM